MLEQNLIRIYEKSFRENRELPALSDYFKTEKFTYFQRAQEIAKLNMMFTEAAIRPGDKIALIGRNNARWCIFLASGAEKLHVLSTALNLMAEPLLPAQKVRPTNGKLCWIIDEAAYKG